MYCGYLCVVVNLTILVSVCQQAAGSLGMRHSFMSNTGSDGSVHTMGSDSHGSFMFNSNSNGHHDDDNVDDVDSAFLPDSDSTDETNNMDMDETYFSAVLNSLQDVPYTDDSASSLALPEKIIYNAKESSGVSRVTFSDGSFDYVSNASAKESPTISSETSAYQFPAYRRHNRTRGHRHRKVSSSHKGKGGSDEVISVSSGNGVGDVISVSGGNGADAVDGGADGSVQVSVSGKHHDRVATGAGKSRSAFDIGKKR